MTTQRQIRRFDVGCKRSLKPLSDSFFQRLRVHSSRLAGDLDADPDLVMCRCGCHHLDMRFTVQTNQNRVACPGLLFGLLIPGVHNRFRGSIFVSDPYHLQFSWFGPIYYILRMKPGGSWSTVPPNVDQGVVHVVLPNISMYRTGM